MKVTNIKKLWIKFIGGGLIKFPHENLREVEIDGDGLDGGGGGSQEEVDEVKTYLDEFATRIKSSEDYDFQYETSIRSFITKEQYMAESIPEELINTLTEQGKIKGDINNFDYVYAEFDYESSTLNGFVFITEEQFDYFKKSIIKASAKDFITSSFMIDNLEQVFGGIDLSGEDAIKNQLAIDKEDFEFAMGREIDGTMSYQILDDIDMSYFASRFSSRSEEELILFDENETRKIFDVTISPLNNNPSNKFRYLNFATSSSNYHTEDTIQINNKNYKYLKLNSSVPD